MTVPKKFFALGYQIFLVLVAVVAIAAATASAKDPVEGEPKVDGMKEILDDIEFANQINNFNASAQPKDADSPWILDATDNKQDGLSQVQSLFAPRPGENADEAITAVQ